LPHERSSFGGRNDNGRVTWCFSCGRRSDSGFVRYRLLIGIGPKDEIEGMIAAQLIAAHNAAMEFYRRAMIGEQTFEGRRENLAQANKLSRTYAALLDALNRHRGTSKVRSRVLACIPGPLARVDGLEPRMRIPPRQSGRPSF
jgi:hypothetical protein